VVVIQLSVSGKQYISTAAAAARTSCAANHSQCPIELFPFCHECPIYMLPVLHGVLLYGNAETE